MLTEDYCSKKVSKLLKEAGFDIPCRYAWHDGITIPDFHRHLRNFNGSDYKDLRSEWYSAPTHQMAMKWLRKECDLHIIAYPYNANGKKKWCCQVYKAFNLLGNEKYVNETLDSYEEAVEAALKWCLTKLL